MSGCVVHTTFTIYYSNSFKRNDVNVYALGALALGICALARVKVTKLKVRMGPAYTFLRTQM